LNDLKKMQETIGGSDLGISEHKDGDRNIHTRGHTSGPSKKLVVKQGQLSSGPSDVEPAQPPPIKK